MWDDTKIINILKMFVTSDRIQEDLEESISRKKTLSLIILSFVNYGEEYRSFIVQGKHTATRSDKGITIDINAEDAFRCFNAISDTLIAFYGNNTDFVFDMGRNLDTGNLNLIETNQNDETTDPYEGVHPCKDLEHAWKLFNIKEESWSYPHAFRGDELQKKATRVSNL